MVEGKHLPIDRFMRSLADGKESRAIGVVLSGTASDGTLGLLAIKPEGGITFAQDGKSAKFDAMPRSAVAAGAVDFVLPAEEIARELSRISSHPYVNHRPARGVVEAPVPSDGDPNRVFALLERAHGVDFSGYKPATVHCLVLLGRSAFFRFVMVVSNLRSRKGSHNAFRLDLFSWNDRNLFDHIRLW